MKQYIVCLTEVQVAMLRQLASGLNFVEVAGQQQGEVVYLVAPQEKPKQVEEAQATVAEEVKESTQEVSESQIVSTVETEQQEVPQE